MPIAWPCHSPSCHSVAAVAAVAWTPSLLDAVLPKIRLLVLLTLASQIVALMTTQNDKQSQLAQSLVAQLRNVTDSEVQEILSGEILYTLPPIVVPWLLPVLAGLGSLLTAMTLRFEWFQRWGRLAGAAAQLKSHIFQFRAHVGIYRLRGRLHDEDLLDEVTPPQGNPEAHARHLFVQRCEEIVRGVGSLGLPGQHFSTPPFLRKHVRRLWRGCCCLCPDSDIESQRARPSQSRIQPAQSEDSEKKRRQSAEKSRPAKQDSSMKPKAKPDTETGATWCFGLGKVPEAKARDSAEHTERRSECLSVDDYVKLRLEPCLQEMEAAQTAWFDEPQPQALPVGTPNPKSPSP